MPAIWPGRKLLLPARLRSRQIQLRSETQDAIRHHRTIAGGDGDRTISTGRTPGVATQPGPRSSPTDTEQVLQIGSTIIGVRYVGSPIGVAMGDPTGQNGQGSAHKSGPSDKMKIAYIG